MDFTGYDKNFSLADKVALVTGAAQGIGKAIVELYAEKGANIILVDLQEEVKDVAASLSKVDRKGFPVIADITKADNVKKVVQDSMKEFGKIDIVVNNAGITRDGLLMRMSEEQWDAVMNVNLKSVFAVTKAATKHMMRAKSGCRPAFVV